MKQPPPTRLAHLCLLLASGCFSLLCLSACITERTGSGGGVPILPRSQQDRPMPPRGTKAPPLPQGPVAAPARSPFTATDIQVEVQPLGSVAYDGQALPLVAPGGNYLAAQEGQAPSWETILAAPGGVAPLSTTITVYAVVKNRLEPLQYAQPLPSGLLLARGADDEGFLVESPRPDGARWIGRVSWASGALTWLVRGSYINAYATLSPRGELIYCRRPANITATADLVIRSKSGEESVKPSPDGAFCYPVCMAGTEMMYVFRVSRVGTDLEAIRIDRSKPGIARPADTRHSWRISKSPDAMLAHQMASTATIPVPGHEERGGDTAAMFDPRKSRMVRFDVTTGGTQALANKTINAAPAAIGLVGKHAMTAGYFVTGPGGLAFLAQPRETGGIGGDLGRQAPAASWPASWPEDAPQARVLASPYVARALRPGTDATGEQFPRYLLIGPIKNVADRLEVTLMAVIGR